MNDKKFAFIICTNNPVFLSECIEYINLLNVPEGYEIDFLGIEEAKSMASGYNEGMTSTDAKYKIYMHQDVFILNKNFLYDILTIFDSDPAIGMIGMVGYPKISANGIMWNEYRDGNKMMFGTHPNHYPNYYYSASDLKNYSFSMEKEGITEVALVDGLMIITCEDLRWNEEELVNWDFYDAFQSMNFVEHGMKVVVPNQAMPWFIHDDGVFLSMINYNKYRQLFMKRYEQYLGKDINQIKEIVNSNK